MREPEAAQSPETAEPVIELAHVSCPVCQDGDGQIHLLCGTPAGSVTVVPMGTPTDIPACVVCHASPIITCNRCGEEIQTQ